MTYVCKDDHELTEDKARWFVDLDNGERIWMDDGHRPWLRLRDYLKEVKAKIVRLYIQFRSHIESPLPENAAGYFFCEAALVNFGNNDMITLFLVGYLDGQFIHTQCWKTPELTQEWTETRQVDSKYKDLLIINGDFDANPKEQPLLS